MASQSIAGINVKIGADLTDLREEVGKVGDTIENNITTGQGSPVQNLANDFDTVTTKAEQANIPIGQIAQALTTIGTAIGGFVKGALQDALEVNEDTKGKVDDLKAAFDSMKVAIGEALIPLIDQWAPVVTEFLNNISKWAKENPETTSAILEISAAFGGLAVTAGAALPIVLAYNTALTGISASAIAAGAGIAGLIALIGLLIVDLYNAEEGVNSLNKTATESFSSVNGDAGGEKFPTWSAADDPTMVADAWGGVKESIEEVSVAAEEVGGAMEGATEDITETKTAAEEAQEVLEQMKLSMEGIGEVTQEVDLGDTMSTLNEVLGSEAFQTFTKEPIAEEVGESWNTFAESITGVADGFGVMEESLGEESPISAGLQQLQGTMGQVITTSNDLCTMFTTTLPTAIQTLLKYVCQVSIDEEGNMKANGGNTLYTSWGTIFGLFSDIFTVCQNLANFWKKDIPEAVKVMIDTSGKAESTLQSLSTTAQGCAGQFNALANAILAVIDAYNQFASLKIGGGGGGRGHSDLFKAEGGPVKYGSTYIVGENGPEIFTPDRSGYIIPNDELTGFGRNVTINVAFEGEVIGDADSIAGYVKRACEEAIREEVYAAA